MDYDIQLVICQKIVEEGGIKVVRAKLAKSMKEAVALSKGCGFPVVLKVASPDIVHKSDIGGVKVGLRSATEVKRAYREIMAAVKQ